MFDSSVQARVRHNKVCVSTPKMPPRTKEFKLLLTKMHHAVLHIPFPLKVDIFERRSLITISQSLVPNYLLNENKN